jgi:hypothetical protein
MKEDHLFCRNCGKKIEGGVVAQIPQPVIKSRPNALVPILWLMAIFAAGLIFGFVGGLIITVAATVWVYSDSKKQGVDESLWVVTLLFAIVGLPLYAYRLHQIGTGTYAAKHER